MASADSEPEWRWNGGALVGNGGVVAVTIFSYARVATQPSVPVIGAACGGGSVFILTPDQFGPFLRQHQNAVLVCHNAAEFHWLLDGHLRSDTAGREALWAFSRNGRLVDIMLLDQHVRQTPTNSVVPRELAEIVQDYTERVVQPADEIIARVANAAQRNHIDDALIEALSNLVTGLLMAASVLTKRAAAMAAELVVANDFPEAIDPPDNAEEIGVELETMLKSVPVGLQDSNQAANLAAQRFERRSPQQSRRPVPFGPLGIGIDVQGAIAAAAASTAAFRTDRYQLEALRQRNEERFQNASRRLHDDAGARACFHWTSDGEPLVVRRDDGTIHAKPEQLRRWLLSYRNRLVDQHGFPLTIPFTIDGTPSLDPTRWGVWAACDSLLAAWRDLDRSSQLARHLLRDGSFQPRNEIVPEIRTRGPDLLAYRSLGIPVFEPADGGVFLIGTLPLLKLRVFAAVQRRHSEVPARLAGYFLAHDDPLERLANELYMRSSEELRSAVEGRRSADQVADEDLDVKTQLSEGDTDYQQIELKRHNQLIELKQYKPEVYEQWRRVAEAVLEAVPLGLPDPLLVVYFQQKFSMDALLGGVVHELVGLVGWIAPETEDFGDRHVRGRFASVLGIPTADLLRHLARHGDITTADAALRNLLQDKQRDNLVWELVAQARHDGRLADDLSDDAIIERVMQYRALTACGRILGPAVHAELRRQEVQMTADEVMKSIAYELVANGLRLVALVGNEFVLEVPAAECDAEFMSHVAELTRDAGRRVLGTFARACVCTRSNQW